MLWMMPAGLLVASCGSGSSSAPAAATSSNLAAQTAAAASPPTTGTPLDIPMTEQMFEAQLLCTTALSYRPCGLVAATDTVSCFIICQAQIATGAENLMARAALECAAQPAEPPDAGSPSCEFQLPGDSPVDAVQLRTSCNARCRDLRADGGVTPGPAATAP